MSYRTDINNGQKTGAIAAVIAIHVALGLAFLHLSGAVDLPGVAAVTHMIDLANPPPPPPPPPPAPKQEKVRPKPKEKSGGSPPNLKSEATPIKAVKPNVVLPPVPTVAASQTPRQGTQATQGASDIAGTGTGTGGTGNGTGNGNGSGGGGDGGVMVPPRLASPVLSGRDFPPGFLDQWPGRATVFMRLKIDERGFVAQCSVDRGTGIPGIDDLLCSLARQRLRYRPAFNRNGQAVAGWAGYAQPAPR